MKKIIIPLIILILGCSNSIQSQNHLSNFKGELILDSFQSYLLDDPTQQLRFHLDKFIRERKYVERTTDLYLIDSLIAESVSGGKIKFLFEYDIEGKMIERTEFLEVTNGNWQIMDKDEYFYDTSNNLIREIYLSWVNAEWDSTIQILYEYDEDNKLIFYTIQWYVTSNWENSSRTTYTYDKAGNEITSLTKLWENNQWTNSGRVYSYYSPENRRDSILFQIWDGIDWQNYSRSSFYYDSSTTFLELVIGQLWTGNQFLDYLKLTVINDELGNQVQQLEQIWNGSTWVNDVKKDYTYIWNYFKSCNAELWNGTNWEPGDTPILVNNPDGFKIAIVSQSINIYYIIVNVESNNSNTPNDFSLSQNYPNPFNPSTCIQYAISSRQYVTLKVYDVLGNEVTTLVNEYRDAGTYETEFNAGKLSSGVYYYQLRAGSFVETKKMIYLK
jgi:hypothetical protein